MAALHGASAAHRGITSGLLRPQAWPTRHRLRQPEHNLSTSATFAPRGRGAQRNSSAAPLSVAAGFAAVVYRRPGRWRPSGQATEARGLGGGVTTAERPKVAELDVSSARFFLVLTSACWATYPVFVKVLGIVSGGAMDPSLVTVLRYTIIAVVGLAFLPAGLMPWSRQRATKPELPDPQELAKASLELAALGLAGTLCNTWGIEHTSAIRAAILLSSINVITPLLSVLIGSSAIDRSVSLQTWLSCGISFAATAFATLSGGAGGASGLQSGDLSVLAAAFFYAAVKVRLAGKARALQPEALAAGRLLAGAFLSWLVFAASALSGMQQGVWSRLATVPPEAWVVLVFSAFIPGALATLLQAKGQSVVPPAQAQTIYAAVPLFAATYEFFILQEPISQEELLAGLAIVVGAALAAREE